PGYPGYLATFVAIGLPHPIALAIVGQIILMIVATIELYLLTFRLASRRWVAGAVATLFGLNVFILQWERAINSEGITIWLLVTLFLIFERYVRMPRWQILAWVTVFLILVVLTRPFYIFLPIFIFGGILWQAWR